MSCRFLMSINGISCLFTRILASLTTKICWKLASNYLITEVTFISRQWRLTLPSHRVEDRRFSMRQATMMRSRTWISGFSISASRRHKIWGNIIAIVKRLILQSRATQTSHCNEMAKHRWNGIINGSIISKCEAMNSMLATPTKHALSSHESHALIIFLLKILLSTTNIPWRNMCRHPIAMSTRAYHSQIHISLLSRLNTASLAASVARKHKPLAAWLNTSHYHFINHRPR